MSFQGVLLAGLLAVLILAPLPFGSVQVHVRAVLAGACLGLGVVWVIWRTRRGLSPVPWREPVLIAGALFALFGVMQLLPLPGPALRSVSPKAVELRGQYEPPADLSPARPGDSAPSRDGWRPISLDPWATRQAAIWFVACLVVALVTLDLAVTPGERRALAVGLVTSGGFQAIYGLAEYFSRHQHIFGYAKKYYTDVATGTFINRNHFAGYLEMTLPLTLALAAAAVARTRAGRKGSLAMWLVSSSGREVFLACALLTLGLAMATAIVCSGSRMGIASLVLALLSVGLGLAWRGRGRGFAVAACVVAGATLLVFSQGGAGASIVGRFLEVAEQFRGELGRWQIWSQAARAAGAFPIVGAGLGVFPAVFPHFRTRGAGTAFAHAHSDYIEVAAEIGLVGCAVAALGIAVILWPILRRRVARPDYGHVGFAALAGLLSLAFHSLTDFNLAIPSNALTLTVLTALAIAWTRVPKPSLAVQGGETRRVWRHALGPAAALALTALVALAPTAARAGVKAMRAGAVSPGTVGRLLMASGGGPEALFEAARTIAGPALEDLEVLARAQLDGGTPSPVAAAYVESRLLEAIALQAAGLRAAPTSPGGHLGLGRLGIGRCAAAALGGGGPDGCTRGALAELRLALELAPMSATMHARAAELLVAVWPALEEDARARFGPILDRAAEMNPENADLRDGIAVMRIGKKPL
ncbi:MAG: O-antigen ligase family protein [Gemmatimonadota bacterium]